MYQIAHRGLSGLYPENTIQAFKQALRLDFKGIEFDVVKMKCGTLSIFHDYNTDRLLNIDTKINNLTLEEANKATKSGQKIPTLDEVLELIWNKKEIHLEIKDDGIYQDVSDALNVKIEKGLKPSNIIVSSFFHENIVETKKRVKGIKTGCLISCVPIHLEKWINDLNADSLNVNLEFINRNLVETAHKHNLKVLAGTANKLEYFEYLKDLGVDGVLSDYYLR